MTTENYLPPIKKIMAGKPEAWDYIVGQLLTRDNTRLFISEICINEDDYEKYKLVRFVVWAIKIVPVSKIPKEMLSEFVRGKIDVSNRPYYFIEDSGGDVVKSNNPFCFLSCIINGSTAIFCEHKIPEEELMDNNIVNNR